MKTKKMRIMIVDDDPLMLQLLRHHVEQLGHPDIYACLSGEAALLQIKETQSPIDLILLDLNLSGMDGVEFIRELVNCQFGGSVSLVSAESDRTLHSVERLLNAQQLTSLGHLHKPVTLASMRALLSRLRPNIGSITANRRPGGALSAEELRGAIAERQFVNYYQPKVSLATDQVVGMECLVRWRHPLKGLVPPSQFIALAEEHNMISQITRLVLAAAMEDSVSWGRLGYRLNVAVNISMEDLSALDFPDAIAELARTRVADPRMISLEITEGRVMGQLTTVLDVLNRLRLKRFRLAMDDFGTGYSSLAQLRDLPFDELKVDRTFIHGAATDPTLRAICRASLRMAHQLKMDTVAEGVESESDWECARHLGFDIAQGYLVAAPMAPTDVIGWLASRSRGTRSRESVPA